MSQVRLYFDTDFETAARCLEQFESHALLSQCSSAIDEIDENSGIWRVSVYASRTKSDTLLNALQKVVPAGIDADGYQSELLEDTGWVEKTLSDLKPVRAGRFLVHGGHDRHVPRANDIAIMIDAGMAFGTGHHGTTAGCLDMITMLMKRVTPKNTLDLGSGSGVLAIAVAKAARNPVLSSDIDPVACETAAQNSRLNAVAGLVTAIAADGFNDRRFAMRRPFDLIIANILARPLQSLAPGLARHLQRGGYAILSGLLPRQRAALLAAYRLQGLVLERTHYRAGWMTLVLKKP